MCTSDHHYIIITFIRITVNSDSFLIFKTSVVAWTKRQQMVNDLINQINFQLRKRMQERRVRVSGTLGRPRKKNNNNNKKQSESTNLIITSQKFNNMNKKKTEICRERK